VSEKLRQLLGFDFEGFDPPKKIDLDHSSEESFPTPSRAWSSGGWVSLGEAMHEVSRVGVAASGAALSLRQAVDTYDNNIPTIIFTFASTDMSLSLLSLSANRDLIDTTTVDSEWRTFMTGGHTFQFLCAVTPPDREDEVFTHITSHFSYPDPAHIRVISGGDILLDMHGFITEARLETEPNEPNAINIEVRASGEVQTLPHFLT